MHHHTSMRLPCGRKEVITSERSLQEAILYEMTVRYYLVGHNKMALIFEIDGSRATRLKTIVQEGVTEEAVIEGVTRRRLFGQRDRLEPVCAHVQGVI